jgi:hypothetical protein
VITSLQEQHGMTMISWLLMFMVLGFFVMLGLRLAPVYLENYTIKNALTSLQQEPLINRKPIGEIRRMLNRRFDINSIDHLSRENIKISRSGGVTKVAVNYEKRQPIIGNIDVIVTFDESITLITN